MCQMVTWSCPHIVRQPLITVGEQAAVQYWLCSLLVVGRETGEFHTAVNLLLLLVYTVTLATCPLILLAYVTQTRRLVSGATSSNDLQYATLCLLSHWTAFCCPGLPPPSSPRRRRWSSTSSSYTATCVSKIENHYYKDINWKVVPHIDLFLTIGGFEIHRYKFIKNTFLLNFLRFSKVLYFLLFHCDSKGF